MLSFNSSNRGKLAEMFFLPPFSVLNAREGFWQDRKREWLSLGIQSEIGRGDNSAPGGAGRAACDYSNNERGHGNGRAITAVGRGNDMLGNGEGMNSKKRYATTYQIGTKTQWEQSQRDKLIAPGGHSGSPKSCNTTSEDTGTGTSIFDPVLCEIAYRWFCTVGGQVVDPFAGGSVRGIVAHKLGYRYWGCDLRAEQVEANAQQAKEITPGNPPTWVCGDSREKIAQSPKADLIFSCPPYGDLEVYSDDPNDLSAMGWPAFLESYRSIIAKSCSRLRDNRFACFVVGEFRDPDGYYRNFVGETVRAFLDAGLMFYNEAILVTSVGSLPIRAGKQFSVSRKLGKTHQNLLVFVKGDARIAANRCRVQCVPARSLFDSIANAN